LQIVYCAWLCFELFFVWMFIVETKGLSLEETVALFDGEQAEENIIAAGHQGEEHAGADIREEDVEKGTGTP
jgi:hypothetical protein